MTIIHTGKHKNEGSLSCFKWGWSKTNLEPTGRKKKHFHLTGNFKKILYMPAKKCCSLGVLFSWRGRDSAKREFAKHNLKYEIFNAIDITNKRFKKPVPGFRHWNLIKKSAAAHKPYYVWNHWWNALWMLDMFTSRSNVIAFELLMINCWLLFTIGFTRKL